MTFSDIINGTGGATNPSKQKDVTGIQMPANGSYQQSLYIAAISKSLGFEGLVSPVSETRDGVELTFDFYHPEAQQLFKVFATFDETTYRQYVDRPAEPIVILDSGSIAHQIKQCECGCEYMQVTSTRVAKDLCEDTRTVIYHDGDLWKYRGHIDGEWTWKKIVPVVLQDFVDEADEMEEEDDLED